MALSPLARRIAGLLAESARIGFAHLNDPHAELKPDRSIVTAADRAIEAFLNGELEDEAAGIRVIGEETCVKRSAAYLDAARREKCFIIDPIDGTAMYAHRIPFWGIIIGYAENGVLVDGGIAIPGTGELLLSDRGRTLYAQSAAPMTEWNFDAELKPLAPPPDRFDDSSLISISQPMAHYNAMRGTNVLTAFCSTAYMTMLLATGRVAAAYNAAHIWDFGGGLCALKNLGFVTIPEFPEAGDLMTLRIDDSNFTADYGTGEALLTRCEFLFATSRESAAKVLAQREK